jgi:ABC-2 type transport system ATP-binding protein
VPQNGIYGFLGLNGAGKTTTIRMLLGLIRPDAGSIQMFGKAFGHEVLGRIGSLVEMPSLYVHLTGRENLEVTRRQVGGPRSAIDRALATVSLTREADRLVREYSQGMRQRLGLALAQLNSPDLLILDEPTNGLDPVGIHDMRELLRRMPVEHGATVFLSSHLLSEVEQVAGWVGIIHEGDMLFQGPIAELRERQQCRLRIGVRERGRALEFLRASGLDAHPDDTEYITLPAAPGDGDRVNRLLLENGHYVFHISVQQDSLEDIFLSFTGGRTQ